MLIGLHGMPAAEIVVAGDEHEVVADAGEDGRQGRPDPAVRAGDECDRTFHGAQSTCMTSRSAIAIAHIGYPPGG